MIGKGRGNRIARLNIRKEGILKRNILFLFSLVLLLGPFGIISFADPGDTGESIAYIPDDNLIKAINDELGESESYEPTLYDLKSITELDAYDYGIKDLTGLEHAINLEHYLDLGDNEINDISALESLTELKVLFLDENYLKDISTLKNLTKLNFLSLYYNQISDISALRNFTDLEYLILSYNDISDISALASMTNLIDLDLTSNQISKIPNLEKLTNLRTLELVNNKISDISGLENLTDLRSLYLYGNQISDLSPLKDLSMLNYNYQIFGVQDIKLPEIEVLRTSSTLEIENPIIYHDGTILDDVITVDDGSYDSSSQKIKWEGLTGTEIKRTFSFDAEEKNGFSGTVIQPIKWIDPKVTLPLNTKKKVYAGQAVTIDGKGTQITFPNDLPSGTFVTITDVSGEGFVTNTEGIDSAGDVLNFEFELPNGQSFTGNSELTMTYGNGFATAIDIYYYNESDKKWVAQNGTKNTGNNTITINPSHFSTFGVFALKEDDELGITE